MIVLFLWALLYCCRPWRDQLGGGVLLRRDRGIESSCTFMSKRAHTQHTCSTHINSHTLSHTLNIRLSSPRGANLPSLGAAKATLLSEEERSTPSHGAHHPPSHYHAHRHSEYRTYRRRARIYSREGAGSADGRGKCSWHSNMCGRGG